MSPFELVEPQSLREAIGLLDADDPSVRAIAGGTAVMLMMLLAGWRLDRTARWLMVLSLTCVSCAALLHCRIWRLPG